MKRIIALFLVVAVVICYSGVVSAQTQSISLGIEETNSENWRIIAQGSDGTWTESSVVSNNITNSTLAIVPHTTYENIFQTRTGEYFLKVNENDYTPVQQITLSLNDYNTYEELKNYNMPEEVMEGIASMAALAEENNCTEANVVVFAEMAQASSGITTIPRTSTTWNGFTFYHYQVYFTNMFTEWQEIASGSQTTQAVLNTIKELIAIAAGSASGFLGTATNIFQGAATCLSAWTTASGQTPIYCDTSNSVYANITYDIYLKYTYYFDPNLQIERHGCSSQRVLIKYIDTDVFLYSLSGGHRLEQTVYPSKTYVSPNYYYPEQVAYYNHIGGWVETVQGSIYNKTIYFAYPAFTWPSDWPQY